jgi:tetraacyldisaccharide 4'-kinase
MRNPRDIAASGLNALWYGGNPICWLLWPLSMVYRGLVAVRRFAFRHRWMASEDVGVPVIVVGNLTVGGTGKTPLTIWISQRLINRGFRVGIVCRGYGGTATDWPQSVSAASDAQLVGDEAKLLANRVSCPIAAGPDRVAAASMLLASGALDVIVSDDGLQHYPLRRAFEIAVIDATRGLGNGLCLPAGPLREPPARLQQVDAVVANEGKFGHTGVLQARIEVVRVRELATGTERDLTDFEGQSVHGVAAIGNPGRFFDLLERHGLEVLPHSFADHARLSMDDLSFGDGKPVLITEKDAVKCEASAVGNLWCVVTELEFASGNGEKLERMLMRVLERQPENL